jgi:hypothetical protein
MPSAAVMPITKRQEISSRKKYRQSPKGRETQRQYAHHYYHSKLKYDPIEKQKRNRANALNYYRENYGITPEYAHQLLLQGCYLCGTHEGKLNVDHRHGKRGVRGILCNPCNLLVGWIELNQHRLPEVMKYIERPHLSLS